MYLAINKVYPDLNIVSVDFVSMDAVSFANGTLKKFLRFLRYCKYDGPIHIQLLTCYSKEIYPIDLNSANYIWEYMDNRFPTIDHIAPEFKDWLKRCGSPKGLFGEKVIMRLLNHQDAKIPNSALYVPEFDN